MYISLVVHLGCADANILFVIDASGNHEQVFIEQIATIVDIIDDLEIDTNHHQVALLLHGSQKKQIVQFSFGAYDSAGKFKSAVKSRRHKRFWFPVLCNIF